MTQPFFRSLIGMLHYNFNRASFFSKSSPLRFHSQGIIGHVNRAFASHTGVPLDRSQHVALEEKMNLVERLLAAKASCGKTYDQIADELGLTNAYVAQLFLNQAQLKSHRVDAMRAAVPNLSEEDLVHMQRCPYRSFDSTIRNEPLVYRLEEAVHHYGEGLKSIVNEKFGDGIVSAIDFHVNVDKIKGPLGEDRCVITLDGKFLPHVEQVKKK